MPSFTKNHMFVAHPSLFLRSEIERFEELLSNKRTTEHEVSHFFAECPKFLLLGRGRRIQREVVIVRKDGEIQRVDFFRQDYGEPFWDIIEIKSPQHAFMVAGKGDHPHVSSYVTKALSQAEDYRDILPHDVDAVKSLASKGIRIFRPKAIVVVGQTDDVDPEVLRILQDRLRNRSLDALSYTQMLEFAKQNFADARLIVMLNGVIDVDLTEYVEERSGAASSTHTQTSVEEEEWSYENPMHPGSGRDYDANLLWL